MDPDWPEVVRRGSVFDTVEIGVQKVPSTSVFMNGMSLQGCREDLKR